MNQSLWMMALLLFAEGGTLSGLTTPTLLYYGKFHDPWEVALFGSLASSAGSALQLVILRWALSSRHAWMQRFAPSVEKVDDAVRRNPSTSFLALLIARATPLPDAPLKLVAAVVKYPISLYSIAVFLGSLPYFYLLALLGKSLPVPGWVLVAGGIAVIALGFAVDRLRARAKKPGSPAVTPEP